MNKPAEMTHRMKCHLKALEENGSEAHLAVRDHLVERWNNPEGWHSEISMWDANELLVFIDLAIDFGLDYEKAYPAEREDEWPLPMKERPGTGQLTTEQYEAKHND